MPGQEPTPGRPPVDLEALTDLCTPWCILVVATLRIADHVAAGTSDIDQLAGATGCDTPALQLREASDFLDLEGIGGRMAHAWSTLPTYVRTGAPGYAEVFGLPFWEDLAAHPEVAASFDALMGPAGHGTPDAEIPISGGWEPVRTVVDVGGGTGAMLAEVFRAHPGIRGTLVDFPGTVARSSEVFDAAGVADRVTTVGQSFLDPLPAGADLYLLRKVLNDWPDRETTAILRRCGEAARPDGRVVVLDGVTDEDAPRRLVIEMLLVGGASNTLSEFAELARAAGLEVASVQRQASGGLVVECRPT